MTPAPDQPLRIGTRGSPLALAQAEEVRARLMAAHALPEDAFQIVTIKTTGDAILGRPLREIGGKGLFTKEIEDQLLSRQIHIAVHSMKDMPTVLPEGLSIPIMLEREDPRDSFVSDRHAALEALPKGAVFGTSSLRRRAQLLALRPDLRMVEFRGNVQTRLKKLADGVAEATILATAGLNRLGQPDLGTPVPEDVLLPAVAQGAIGVEIRSADVAVHDLLAPIHHEDTGVRLAAERAFLAGLDGSCRTPIAGHATLRDGRIAFRGQVVRPDGSETLTIERDGPAGDAAPMGADAAAELVAQGARSFF